MTGSYVGPRGLLFVVPVVVASAGIVVPTVTVKVLVMPMIVVGVIGVMAAAPMDQGVPRLTTHDSRLVSAAPGQMADVADRFVPAVFVPGGG